MLQQMLAQMWGHTITEKAAVKDLDSTGLTESVFPLAWMTVLSLKVTEASPRTLTVQLKWEELHYSGIRSHLRSLFSSKKIRVLQELFVSLEVYLNHSSSTLFSHHGYPYESH